MRILLASHTAPGGVFTVGSHHLSRELASLGHQVCHLSTPVSLVHATRLREPEVRRRFALAAGGPRRQSGAMHYLPLTLLPMSAGSRLTSTLGLRTAVPGVGSTLRRLGFATVDALVIDQPLLAGIERYVDADLVVYRPTDIVESRAKSDGEDRVLAIADGVVATSQLVLDRVVDRRPGLASLLLENGVQFEHFSAPGGQPREGAVYVGAIDERFDWEGLSAMAEQNPTVPVDIFGPHSGVVPAMPPNVSVHGAVSYGEAPQLLRRARVGILPFKRNAMNRGRSPMKLYEYLAAGLNVVTTMSPAEDDPPGVWAAEDEHGGGESLRRAYAAPVNERGVQVARSIDWSERSRRLVDFLTELRRGP